jgi:hypothetical protein
MSDEDWNEGICSECMLPEKCERFITDLVIYCPHSTNPYGKQK